MSKKYTIFDLLQFVVTMVVPIWIFCMEIYWNCSWYIGVEEDAYGCMWIRVLDSAPLCLMYAIINSHCLHFCKYHRMMMYAVLGMFGGYYLSPELSVGMYNIASLILLSVACIGFFVTMYRFTKQLVSYGRKITTMFKSSRRVH